jgi:hypothetical protein
VGRRAVSLNIAITLDTYSQVLPNMKEKAA